MSHQCTKLGSVTVDAVGKDLFFCKSVLIKGNPVSQLWKANALGSVSVLRDATGATIIRRGSDGTVYFATATNLAKISSTGTGYQSLYSYNNISSLEVNDSDGYIYFGGGLNRIKKDGTNYTNFTYLVTNLYSVLYSPRIDSLNIGKSATDTIYFDVGGVYTDLVRVDSLLPAASPTEVDGTVMYQTLAGAGVGSFQFDILNSRYFYHSGGTIYRKNLDGSGLTAIEVTGITVNGIYYNPTSTKIYYCGKSGTTGKMYRCDDDGANTELIYSESNTEFFSVYSI